MHSAPVNHGFFDRIHDESNPIIFDGEEIRLTHDELAQLRLIEPDAPASKQEPAQAQA